jgi:hypothetical protein
MAKVTLQCPSCGGQVDLGDIECRHCGMNLKSGESYDEQIKKAKGKDKHAEHFATPLLMAVAFVFGLLVLAGWLFQSRMEKAIQNERTMFVEYIREFQAIDDLVVAGNYQVARERTEALIKRLDRQAETMDVPDPYTKEKKDPYRPSTLTSRPKGYKPAAIRQLLQTLTAKAERKLKEIPVS